MGEGPPYFILFYFIFEFKVSCPGIEYAFSNMSQFQIVDLFKNTDTNWSIQRSSNLMF